MDNRRVNLREDRMAFDHLRLEMYNNPSFQWNIAVMANKLGLSRSRFSVLYQQLYNTSPVEDLIAARIHRAKYLLTTSGMTINRISDETGYHTIEHFVRQLKPEQGVPPLNTGN